MMTMGAGTYSSSEMTRVSTSSSTSSSASSSPVLFSQTQTSIPPPPQNFSHEESSDNSLVERHYGGVPARDAALVIQRAYRRYSMVKEFQRIKTERRLSRRINNNVVGSSNSSPINSCEICIEVHGGDGSALHGDGRDVEGLEEGLDKGYLFPVSRVQPQYHHPPTSYGPQRRLSEPQVNHIPTHGQPHPHHHHQQQQHPSHHQQQSSQQPQQHGLTAGKLLSDENEIIRKRLYRVGLNLFNKKPEAGVAYLVRKKFLEGSPPAVARFLVSRKGLSKQMIGEYLTNLQSPFSLSCLEHFVNEIDLSKLPVDLALRKFQSYYRMPGEAQKIERLMESFSRRYGACNPHVVAQFRNGADTVFVLAFAIIMLNTDLHTPHLKQDRRMKLEDFVKNLRGVDDGADIPRDILVPIYEGIKNTEFKTGSDHVTQVMKVQQTIVGKKPNLAIPSRRLVCYCRLYEVSDVQKKEKIGTHQREVFLFNDTLVLTKIFHKKRNSVTYSFRQSYPLAGLTLALFQNQYYEYGLTLKRGSEAVLSLNARNEHDRAKFTEDLREAIAESDEMVRIENSSNNRDSGVDVGKIKRFSNSLLDINDQCKPVRRGSCGSLDSGMSVSFQSDEHQHQHQGSTCSSSSSTHNHK